MSQDVMEIVPWSGVEDFPTAAKAVPRMQPWSTIELVRYGAVQSVVVVWGAEALS